EISARGAMAYGADPSGCARASGHRAGCCRGCRTAWRRIGRAYRRVQFRQPGEYVSAGGLMSYGPDYDDIFRLSANYVDRILKGASPGDLPAQAPTKYELVINLKAAKELGLDVPRSLVAIADEVIE